MTAAVLRCNHARNKTPERAICMRGIGAREGSGPRWRASGDVWFGKCGRVDRCSRWAEHDDHERPGGGLFHWSPHSGPPGTVISVDDGGRNLCANVPGAYVNVTFMAQDQLSVPLSSARADIVNNQWSTTLEVPADADPNRAYAFHAECWDGLEAPYGYGTFGFYVTRPALNTTSSSSTTVRISDPTIVPPISDPTTVTDEARPPTTATSASTVASAATLPRTGSNDSTALAAFGVSLLASGGLLVLSRRRLRRS